MHSSGKDGGGKGQPSTYATKPSTPPRSVPKKSEKRKAPAPPPAQRSDKMAKVQCHNCKGYGHFARDCPGKACRVVAWVPSPSSHRLAGTIECLDPGEVRRVNTYAHDSTGDDGDPARISVPVRGTDKSALVIECGNNQCISL